MSSRGRAVDSNSSEAEFRLHAGVRGHSIFAPFLLQVGYRLRGLGSTVVAR